MYHNKACGQVVQLKHNKNKKKEFVELVQNDNTGTLPPVIIGEICGMQGVCTS